MTDKAIKVAATQDSRTIPEKMAAAAAIAKKWEKDRAERADQKVADEREAYRIKPKQDMEAAKRATERSEHKEWLEDCRRRSAEKASRIARATSLLSGLGIRMKIEGCGCCGSPTVTLHYGGDMILDQESEAYIDTYDLTGEDIPEGEA